MESKSQIADSLATFISKHTQDAIDMLNVSMDVSCDKARVDLLRNAAESVRIAKHLSTCRKRLLAGR